MSGDSDEAFLCIKDTANSSLYSVKTSVGAALISGRRMLREAEEVTAKARQDAQEARQKHAKAEEMARNGTIPQTNAELLGRVAKEADSKHTQCLESEQYLRDVMREVETFRSDLYTVEAGPFYTILSSRAFWFIEDRHPRTLSPHTI